MKWLDAFDDYPSWGQIKANVEAELYDGGIVNGVVEYDDMTPGPNEEPLVYLKTADENINWFDDIKRFRFTGLTLEISRRRRRSAALTCYAALPRGNEDAERPERLDDMDCKMVRCRNYCGLAYLIFADWPRRNRWRLAEPQRGCCCYRCRHRMPIPAHAGRRYYAASRRHRQTTWMPPMTHNA